MVESQHYSNNGLNAIISLHDKGIELFRGRNFAASLSVFRFVLWKLQWILEAQSDGDSGRSERREERNNWYGTKSECCITTFTGNLEYSMDTTTSRSQAPYVRPLHCQELTLFTGAFCLRKLCSIIPSANFVEVAYFATGVVLYNIGVAKHIIGLRDAMVERCSKKARWYYESSYQILRQIQKEVGRNDTENHAELNEVMSLMSMALCLNLAETMSSTFYNDSVENKTMTNNLLSKLKMILESILIRRANGAPWITITVNDVHFFYQGLMTTSLVDNYSVAPAA